MTCHTTRLGFTSEPQDLTSRNYKTLRQMKCKCGRIVELTIGSYRVFLVGLGRLERTNFSLRRRVFSPVKLQTLAHLISVQIKFRTVTIAQVEYIQFKTFTKGKLRTDSFS